MAGDLSILAAFIAGLLSFLSPCVMPLISSYLIFISGTAVDRVKERSEARKNTPVFSAYQAHMVKATTFFILGFSCVFIILSILFSSIFMLIGGATRVINYIAGAMVIILGLNILFDFIPFLNYEKRFQFTKRPQNFLDSFIVGLAFGAGWTPCIGPILGSILLMAGQSGKLLISLGYLLVYSLGLGIPFLLAAFFFGSLLKSLEKLKPWRPFIHTLSGIFIIGIGIFIVLGRFQNLNIFLSKTGYALAEGAESNSQIVKFIPALIFFIIALIPLTYRIVRKIKTFSAPSLVFCGIFMVLSIAQITGIINSVKILSQWFMFIGI